MLKSLFGKGDSGKPRALRVGDSVRVKAGIKDDDLGLDLGGWQGRITEVDEKNELVLIISDAEEQGLGWDTYYLAPDDVELAEARDTKKRTETVRDQIHAKFAWHFLGEEGQEISRILAGIDPSDMSELLERWEEYFSTVLKFPFKAEVTESQDRGPMHSGDILVVQEIDSIEEMYGLLVRVKKGRTGYFFPLCDLTPVDKKSSNYQPVRNYAIWFANRW
jgi:hypothetical protein